VDFFVILSTKGLKTALVETFCKPEASDKVILAIEKLSGKVDDLSSKMEDLFSHLGDQMELNIAR
jgi:hypothetical protein